MTKAERDFIDLWNSLDDRGKALTMAYMRDITGDNIRPYYDINRAAGMLGVTYRTCIQYIRDGKLKAHKIGGKWGIYPEDLNAFIDNR